ncbi:hypothetical protein [Erythrobacter sp. SD-21]|nr:hypothetical protein [Erythrobacter sp. SD-21]EDL48020.1 hypothetical protein ED21_29276 [Erythrobacter sp. SD-21]
MMQKAFLALSLAMLGGGTLAAKSAIDIQNSAFDGHAHASVTELPRLAAQ